MGTLGNTFLTTVDRFVSRSSSVNRFIDLIASKVTPQTIAKAGCHGGYKYCKSTKGAYCYWFCGYNGYSCVRKEVYHEIIHYSPSGNCNSYTLTCDDGCDYIRTTSTPCSPCPY